MEIMELKNVQVEKSDFQCDRYDVMLENRHYIVEVEHFNGIVYDVKIDSDYGHTKISSHKIEALLVVLINQNYRLERVE